METAKVSTTDTKTTFTETKSFLFTSLFGNFLKQSEHLRKVQLLSQTFPNKTTTFEQQVLDCSVALFEKIICIER